MTFKELLNTAFVKVDKDLYLIMFLILLKHEWHLWLVGFKLSTWEMQEVALMEQQSPFPGGTRLAGLLSNFQCYEMLTKYQRLQTERNIVKTKYSLGWPLIVYCWLALINCQDLWVKILRVDLLHHILIYGQPRCANTQFSGPQEAQLLQGEVERFFGSNPVFFFLDKKSTIA